MTKEKSRLEELKVTIEQLRDEINLKAHLGKAETKDELEKLEKKWHEFQHQMKPFSEEMGKTAKSAGTALGLVGEELKAGYERIRKLL